MKTKSIQTLLSMVFILIVCMIVAIILSSCNNAVGSGSVDASLMPVHGIWSYNVYDETGSYQQTARVVPTQQGATQLRLPDNSIISAVMYSLGDGSIVYVREPGSLGMIRQSLWIYRTMDGNNIARVQLQQGIRVDTVVYTDCRVQYSANNGMQQVEVKENTGRTMTSIYKIGTGLVEYRINNVLRQKLVEYQP